MRVGIHSGYTNQMVASKGLEKIVHSMETIEKNKHSLSPIKIIASGLKYIANYLKEKYQIYRNDQSQKSYSLTFNSKELNETEM